jgi:hypothetical protein
MKFCMFLTSCYFLKIIYKTLQKAFLLVYLFIIYLFLYVCLFCLHVFLCTTYVPGVHKSKKRASLELELQIVVSLHLGASNWIQILWRNSQCSWRLSISLVPRKQLSSKFYSVRNNEYTSESNWVACCAYICLFCFLVSIIISVTKILLKVEF